MTSEVLKALIPKVEVKDRSTADINSEGFLQCLQENQCFQVADCYVNERNEIGVPYEEAPTGNVQLLPEFGEKDFLVLSVGRNDYAVHQEEEKNEKEDFLKEVKEILGYVKEIINIYKANNVKPERMFYIIPHPPTELEKTGLNRRGIDIAILHLQFMYIVKEWSKEEGINLIWLNDFDD